jgi:hypothetical protein
MPSWKRVVVSGSDAALNSLNVTAALTASGIIYPSSDGTLGQVLVTDGAGQLSFSTISSGGTGSSVKLSQTVPATTWSFAHNLNEKFPAVTIYDSNDEVIIPQKIDAIDSNNLIVYFSSPTTGTAAAVVGGSTVSSSYSLYAETATSASYALTSSYSINPTVSGSIGPVDSIYFNTSSGVSVNVAEIAWNPADGTFDMGLLNNVTLQVGQEMHFYGKATGAISNGDAVMFAGSEGDHILISKAAQAIINEHPEYFIGIATQNFNNNDFGYVTVLGKVRGLNTLAYTQGAVLYFDSEGSTAGALTQTKPVAPNAKIEVAAVIRVHANQGILEVRPHVMPKLEDIQDVGITNASFGDLLVRNSNTWRNTKQLSGSYSITGSLNSTIQLPDNTATPSAANAGSMRYRVSGNNSYVDMVMQTGATTYTWVNIVENNW